MPSAAQTPDLFSDFVAAGAASPAGHQRDALDEIGDWLKASVAHIAVIRSQLALLTAEGKRRYGARFSDYEFSRRCDPDEMSKACWDIAVRLVEADYIAPKHVEVSSVRTFLLEAFSLDSEPQDEERDEFLKLWDAEKIRVHFRRTFGDVREAAIAQLKGKALDAFGRRRPEEVSTMWCHLHEHAHRVGIMRLTYQSGKFDRFGDIVRYLMHLATGVAPSDITLPPIFGYNDRSNEWERCELLKRQKSPFPGCEWLRFTADGYLQIRLADAVLALIQSQFDASGAGSRDD